jgi:hypothetical protein
MEKLLEYAVSSDSEQSDTHEDVPKTKINLSSSSCVKVSQISQEASDTDVGEEKNLQILLRNCKKKVDRKRQYFSDLVVQSCDLSRDFGYLGESLKN